MSQNLDSNNEKVNNEILGNNEIKTMKSMSPLRNNE